MTQCKDIGLTLKAVMTKELVIPPGTDISLADLIKKCLNRDLKSRYEITDVLEHPFLATRVEKRPLGSMIGGKFGLLSAQKVKRTSSQSSQRTGISIGSVVSKSGSVDKRSDTIASTYQSLLKDLSKQSMENDEKPRLIKTAGMQPCSYSTKNGKISILKDGSVEVDLSAKKQKIVRISPDGETIHVTNITDKSKGMYLYSDMPSKYLSVYKYAYEVLNLIKAKIPRAKLENQTGRFLLMMNEPFPNYEAHFSNGLTIKHIVSTDILKLSRDNGEERIVKLNSQDIKQLDPVTQDHVKIAMKYVDLCQRISE